MSGFLTPPEVSNRRARSEWKRRISETVGEISPVIATGLLIHCNKGSAIREAGEALEALEPAIREKLWQAAFPGIAREVGLAWEHLPMSVVARRDAGSNGLGEPFTWPLGKREADDLRIDWLRKLLIVAGPFPELGFAGMIRQLGLIAAGRSEEAADQDDSGHFYDEDALAYVAAALLSREPGSGLAQEVVEVLDEQWLGRAPHGVSRAICTAWLCAERPDLWARMDRYLAESGKEPGFQMASIASREGILPGALLHLLQTIRDGQMLRFPPIAEWVKSVFGIPWQWKGGREDLQSWFVRWVELQESVESREQAFTADDPGDFALALWGDALHDGAAVLERLSRPERMSVNQRLAAAHFLRACPIRKIAPAVLKYATDSDLRVANTAAPLLAGSGAPSPTTDELPDRFAALGAFLGALPANPELSAMPAPFPEAALDLGVIPFSLVKSISDGQEAVLDRLLPSLDTAARNAVIYQLNRYRLTAQDKEIARILRGEGAKDLSRWLEETGGVPMFAQRGILLKLLHDRVGEIAEHAFKAVKSFTPTAEEAALLRPLLATRNAKKLGYATHLIANQPPGLAARFCQELLKSRIAGERLAALEILRLLSLADPAAGTVREVLAAAAFKPASADEERAFAVLREALGPVEAVEAPSLSNAFGLVDPRMLAQPTEPRELPVMLHSPVTVMLIHALDAWLTGHADTIIPTTQPWITQEPQRLGDVTVPTPGPWKTREENLQQFPPAHELVAWWDGREAEFRDDDGFELIRLQAAGSAIGDQRTSRPDLMRGLFGIESEIVTRSKKYEITRLIDWLVFLRPDELSPPGWQEFLVDAAETAVARLEEGKKGWAQAWVEPVNQRLLRAEGTPEALLRRYWELGRGRGHWDPRALHFWIHDVARFCRLGIASEEEVIWRLVGERPFGKYDEERAFSDLEAASMRSSRPRPDLDHPAFAAVVRKVCDRIVELELARGETPEVWSRAAIAIKRLEGARHLARLLGALGSLPLTRKKNYSHDPDLTRPGVLVHLIGVCHPAADDTPEDFARLMRESGVSEDRLLEIAVFRPVWTGFIEHATGIAGLRDAVGWIFAHTRSADYPWEANARELWTGELGFDSPIAAEDFVVGAVDCGWFARAHRSVGDEIWDKLYAAARFASTGRGHTRARLFADALLGKSVLPDLKALLEDKANLDAALAIGLPELPEEAAKRSKELLERYEILQGLKERSKKSKAQRRASELAAFEMGVRNLARRAGFADTLRFEWVMETEASADLEAGRLQARIGDVDLAIGILPDGALELAATRSGKPLASVPAAVKKHADFKVLRGRMDELKQQAQRIRPALEDLMARGVALNGGEWSKLSAHPLAGPLLARLVLVTDSGQLALPVAGGLEELDGRILAWPTGPIRLAHPVDFLPTELWHGWQRLLFERTTTQPFKQVFRELYLPASSDTTEVARFEKQRVNGQQAAAILTRRGWNFHPEQGIHRIFRADGIVAWLGFEESFHHFGEHPQLTLSRLHFTGPKPFQRVPVADVPLRVFSEVLRDVDLIVSVAHAAGADPEATASTVETRSALVRETCRLLGLKNVRAEGNHVRIAGKLGNYRVHLASGVVHRDPGGMIPVHSVPQAERGRIFLPFAEDDVPGVEILSRVLLFAADDQIRDPALAAIIRTSQPALEEGEGCVRG